MKWFKNLIKEQEFLEISEIVEEILENQDIVKC